MVPAELFTTPYVNPVNGNPEAVRNNLREATRLLKEAGFEIKDRKLVDASGKPVNVEFLTDSPSMERLILFYKPSLERLGVTVSVRTVDDAQYENRLRSFDFDMTAKVWAQSLSPGNEQREFWGSQSADRPGSQNLCGIRNPAVDAMIEQVIFAKDRPTQIAASKALDRVLLWNFYVVPHYISSTLRYARWDRFSHAEPLPKYGISGFPRSGGMMRTKRPGSASDLEEFFAHGAAHPPACAGFRHRRHRRGVVAAGDSGRYRRGGAWPFGVRRSEISAGLSPLRLRQSGGAEGRAIFDDSLGTNL